MRLYALLAAAGLSGATAFGYYSGKDTAQERFTTKCETAGFVVVYDPGSDRHRHFHCFELQAEHLAEPEPRARPDGQLVL